MYLDSEMAIIRSVTIKAGESLSTILVKRYYKYVAIFLPATWTTAPITFLGCSTKDGTYKQIVSSTDVSEITIPAVVANKVIAFDTEFMESMIVVPFLKIQSGTLLAPVNQAAEVEIKIILRR